MRRCVGYISGLSPVRHIAAILVTILLVAPVRGQGFVDEKDALNGLEGVYVMGGDLDDLLAAAGLRKDDILSTVISQLTIGGVRVLDETDWLMLDDAPVLHVEVVSKVEDTDRAIYGVRIEVLYLMNPVSNRSFTTYAVAWGEGEFGTVNADSSSSILRDLRRIVDRFVADFHEANSS